MVTVFLGEAATAISRKSPSRWVVTSEPGQGTTFKVCLPQIAAVTVATTVAGQAEVPRGRGEIILLVEDEKSLHSDNRGG